MKQIRAQWPGVRVILRGDSGFCRDELMDWCERQQNVYYVFGMARNERLRRIVAPQMAEAAAEYELTQRPARVFADFQHQTTTGSWARERRVVAKAEHIAGKENPRYLVTSLPAEDWPAQKLYEELYCGRGDMENRIKEQFHLFADRVSAETMQANQFRLYLSGHRLCAGQRTAQTGFESYRTGPGSERNYPYKSLQGWRAGPRQRAPGAAVSGLGLSVAIAVPADLDEPALLKRDWRTRLSELKIYSGCLARRSVPCRAFLRPQSLHPSLHVARYRPKLTIIFPTRPPNFQIAPDWLVFSLKLLPVRHPG